ncbi:hypothetical protein WMY93_005827 [Mugilogobius chulae]|uniref:Uncharacterized protein n=1 Tax=Mugilogobius chulae TaxID=88201 RepID=A0AAW0PRT5_9GOBI
MHDYIGAQLDAAFGDFPSLPSSSEASPAASPAAKQSRLDGSSDSVPMVTMLAEFAAMRSLVNRRADEVGGMVQKNCEAIAEVKAEVKGNTVQINAMSVSLDQMCAELISIKERVDLLETQAKATTVNTSAFMSRLSLLESYSRRWNLKLHGLEENEQQDVRRVVTQLFQDLLPEARNKLPDVVDTVHRLGPRKPNVTRGIIIQFTSRHYRDALWRAAKNSPLLAARKLRLTEDFSPEDRERRQQLWPQIERARKEVFHILVYAHLRFKRSCTMRLLLGLALIVLFLCTFKNTHKSWAVSFSDSAVSLLLSPLSVYSWLMSILLRLILSLPALILNILHQSWLLGMAFPWCIASISFSLAFTILHVTLYLLHLSLVLGVVAILTLSKFHSAKEDIRPKTASSLHIVAKSRIGHQG